MKIPQIKSSIISNAYKKAVNGASKAQAKEQAKIIQRQAEKQRILADRELKILPELNILGLPMWM